MFISYSRRDNHDGHITQLVDRIKADFARFAHRDLVPFFDVSPEDGIKGMEDWRQKILRGLRESRLLLVCLSPTYLESEYCEWEFVEYLKYEIGHLHGFNGVAPIYFVEVPGWSQKDFEQQCATWVAELRRRQSFDLRPWHDRGQEALREAVVQERMRSLNERIVATITRSERAERSLGNVDAHNPHFIGRTTNLRLLRENFVKPGNIGVLTAVNGMGGLGKTALAIEYAHAFADEYGGGRWQVRCEGKDDLRLALAELATPIGFAFTDDEKKDADLQIERTRRELRKLADAGVPHRCLLILDNVDRPDLLDPALVARLNGGDWLHVIATTRLGEDELHGTHRDRSFLPVDELPLADALSLIESYQFDGRFRDEAERNAAFEIVQLLGCFTLAVESAAVYLGQFANDVTCAAFLTRLKKEGLQGLDTAAGQSREGVLHGEKRLGVTLKPTLERLGPAEKLALGYAALLPADYIVLPWLRALVSAAHENYGRDAPAGYPDDWTNLLRRIFGLRLLQASGVTGEDGILHVARMHRLLQSICRERSFSKRRIQREEIFEQARAGTEAEPLFRQVLLEAEELVPRNESQVASAKADLGRLLLELKRISEAEPLIRQAFEAFTNMHGEEHHDTLTALNDLALLSQQSGDWATAEVMFRKVLDAQERNLGPGHPGVAASLNNLALVLMRANRLAEAEPLMRRALAIVETLYGPDHPDVAAGLYSLAAVLQVANRLAEAVPVARRAVLIYLQFQRSTGHTHPNVAPTTTNYSSLLMRMGCSEAEISDELRKLSL
ncbi:MAG: tetratricopeptide repeat protein [Flavobacteriales bacterium]|nr:tetratricopeptide repeat protein [Flavobacteriales bacterium]